MAIQHSFVPYCGAGPIPAELMSRWNLDPPLLAALAVAGGLMAWRGRTDPGARAGLAGLGVLAVLFVSPLCALSSALFAARTVHHVALIVLAAPLLAAALPRAWPRLGLVTATGLQALVLWAWHAPAAYAWALSYDAAYWLMQASLLAAAVAFWAAAARAGPAAAVGALLATMVQMGLLGAILTFAPRAVYAPHFLTTRAWGLSPLEDQQLAGLIMWAPATGLYLLAALAIAYRGLATPAPARAAT